MSFVTGSHAYGIPEAESDIDLVVMVSKGDLNKLRAMANFEHQFIDGLYLKKDAASLRFGKLNLLCATDKKSLSIWRKGTKELKKQKPVSRAFAIKFMDKFWAEIFENRPYSENISEHHTKTKKKIK